MKIAGLVKTSLCDYPGKVASVIFTSGCNFNCPYCHNHNIIDTNNLTELIPEKDIIKFLNKRKNLIKNVVISGGEPCLQKDLITFVAELKSMDFKIKLDTNGSFPGTLKQLVEKKLIDYVAMDIKAPLKPEILKCITGVNSNIEDVIINIYESIKILNYGNIDYEFRSTLIKELHSFKDICEMASYCSSNYKLQQYSNKYVEHEIFSKYSSYSEKDTLEFIKKLKTSFPNTNISYQ